MYPRIIPRLDIKGTNLVKGINLEGLRVLGKPEDFARMYYRDGADELIYIDAVASLYGRNSILGMVERVAQEVFIPLTVGGGIRTIHDINAALRAGADKVALNTAAIKCPEFISEAAKHFGSSTIVLSVEAKKKADDTYEAYIDYGRTRTGLDVVQWVRRAVELGVGEVLLTSIDNEGTGKGFDSELIRLVTTEASVPVISSGGAGTLEHIRDVISGGDADAVAIASMLHYKYLHKQVVNIDGMKEGNLEFLRSGGGYSRVVSADLPEIKEYLLNHGVYTRMDTSDE